MSKVVSVSGGSLQVETRGAGRPLLLVHGFPLDHRMWREQIDVLAATHHVIAPDLRGFAKSVVTAGEVSMEQMADDLAAVLDGLQVKEPVVFCGLSMGGYIAWQFFLRHRARLRALILCDTRALPDTPDAAALRRRAAEQVVADGPEAIAEAMAHRLWGKKTKESRPEPMKFIHDMILAQPPHGIAAAQLGLAKRIDATPLLARIDVPTLVVCGVDDAIAPLKEMRGLAEAIPGAEFAEIPDAGHMAPLENPGPVNAAIGAFLDRLK